MASAFGHAFSAFIISKFFKKGWTTWKILILGIIYSILPDADVIGFKFGIAYESFWGHRGFTHSFLFAALNGLVFTFLFYFKDIKKVKGLLLFLFFTFCTAAHPILDAMTSGGLGVAFFSPWDNSRYFFPWRPIKVSPIGIGQFFSTWGVKVLLSELIWIGIPGLILLIIKRLFAFKKKETTS